MDPDVLFIPELSRLLGMTEAAVRGHYYRRSGAIPRGFKLGRRLAWRRSTVQAFLADLERRANRGP
jgi:predicted DNA-binding transcriptional regulator AlpA